MTHREKCGNLYRDCVKHGLRRCEMQCRNKQINMSVHHPIERGRSIVYQFDLRNGMWLCGTCHARYDHALPLLAADCRLKGIHREQMDWCERHYHDVTPQAKAWIDEDAELYELQRRWKAINTGEATRETYRDWSE